MATMTATTTATATTTVPDVKPLQSKKKSTSSRPFTAAAPPPVDLEGKTVPFSQRWGFSSHVFTNDLIRSSVFDAVVIGSFVAFNASPYAIKTYAYLEENFTPFQINAYGTFAITTLLYWAFAGLFAFVDLTGRPRFLFKYKVQPFARVDARDYAKIAQVVIKNQLIVVLPLILAKGKIFPSAISPSKLQGPWETLGHIFFNVLCTEVGFYFIHKTFHSPALYATYHKQHHTLTAPVGLGATYCGVAEHLFSNLLPNAIGTTILQPHWSVALFTFCYLEIGTICAHSGYNFPYMHTSLRHDWHHFSFNENFGPTGLLDILFGTGKRYDQALADGMKRNGGDLDKAREDLLARLAVWEASTEKNDAVEETLDEEDVKKVLLE